MVIKNCVPPLLYRLEMKLIRTMRTVRLLQGDLKHSNVFPVQGASRKMKSFIDKYCKRTMKEQIQKKNKKMKTSDGKRNFF